jgi:orotidine-5'-phosphate decarboxylase
MPQSPVILALDVSTEAHALAWVKRLRSQINIFKIGMELFYAAGPDIVLKLHDLGVDVFLDLKLLDIPTTVEKACASVARLAPRFLTLHTMGGSSMIQAAQAGIGSIKTTLVGVTVLTSVDTTMLQKTFASPSLDASLLATHLAIQMSQEAGLKTFVCSAHENRALLQHIASPVLINPGIRLSVTEATHDQKRIMTPQQALLEGASYLVIGRAITQAADPEAVITQIHSELNPC